MTTTTTRTNTADFQTPVQSASVDFSHHQGFLITAENSSDWELWQELIDDLLRARMLEDDYDGQGAKAPDPELVDSAIRLACQLRANRFAPANFATAGVNGTVHFEWMESQSSLDIEVIAPGLAEICAVHLLGDAPPLRYHRW